MLKYNFGCGSNPIKDYINVDVFPHKGVDVVMDIRGDLGTLAANSASEVLLFHTIEHIEKEHYRQVFYNINELLIEGGSFYLSFPDFFVSVSFYEDNKRGSREFWEKTIFGRGTQPYDFHRSIATREEIENFLVEAGFKINSVDFEDPPNECNCIIKAVKIRNAVSYEDTLKGI